MNWDGFVMFVYFLGSFFGLGFVVFVLFVGVLFVINKLTSKD